MAVDDLATVPAWQWLPWSPGRPVDPVARTWLAQRLDCAPGAIELVRDAHGRPRLGPAHGADASWSHSGEGLLLAVARRARVGIDLEREHPRPRALELARRYFTPAETAWLQDRPAGDARGIAFLRLWCAKEAVLKAHGRGLAFGLHRLAFAEREGTLSLVDADPALGDARDWRLHEFAPQPGYRAALAWKPDR